MRLSLSIYKRITASHLLLCDDGGISYSTAQTIFLLNDFFTEISPGWSRSCRDLLSTASNTTRPRRLCHQDDANKSFYSFFPIRVDYFFVCVCVYCPSRVTLDTQRYKNRTFASLYIGGYSVHHYGPAPLVGLVTIYSSLLSAIGNYSSCAEDDRFLYSSLCLFFFLLFSFFRSKL